MYGYSDYEKQQSDMNQQSTSSGGKGYYWMGVIRNGKLVILGAKNSEIEAESYLDSYAPGEQHVIQKFNSKDIHKVSGMFKSKALEQYHDLGKALSHNILSQSEQIKNKKAKNEGAVGQNEYKKEVKKHSKPLIPDMFEGQEEEY
jgi:hypothetical protein